MFVEFKEFDCRSNICINVKSITSFFPSDNYNFPTTHVNLDNGAKFILKCSYEEFKKRLTYVLGNSFTEFNSITEEE